MNRFLSCAIFIAVSVAFVGAHVEEARYSELCNGDQFEFSSGGKKVEINAFAQQNTNFTLKPIGHFMTERSLNFNEDFEGADASALSKLASEYNELIKEVYSPKFMNDEALFSTSVEKRKMMKNMKAKAESYLGKSSDGDEVVKKLVKTIKRGLELMEIYISFQFDMLSEKFLPLGDFNNLYNDWHYNLYNMGVWSMNIELTGIYLHTLMDRDLSIYYEHALVKLDREPLDARERAFNMIKASSTFSSPEDYAMIKFKLFLPAYDPNWTGQMCSKASPNKTPRFINKKGELTLVEL